MLNFFAKILGIFFWKNDPLWETFEILFEMIHHLTDRHVVQMSWNLADGKPVKSWVIYLPKKANFKFRLVLLRGSRPKSVRASPRQCTQCFRFHPNRFTFGGVICERVNIVKTGC